MSIFDDDIKRLEFEDYIWVIFIVLSILNIIGDNCQKKYLNSNNMEDNAVANNIFSLVLFITLIIYIYFFIRNVDSYKKADILDKDLLGVKVFGSILFVVGILCLIYFQVNQSDFYGTPI